MGVSVVGYERHGIGPKDRIIYTRLFGPSLKAVFWKKTFSSLEFPYFESKRTTPRAYP